MSFPVAPTNGQIALINGVSYTYASATNSWTRNVGVQANVNASNVTAGNLSVTTNLTVTGDSVFTGNILPSANITYDLGSATYRWRDIFLSGNTINLGGASIKTDASSGAIALIPPSTVDNPNPTGVVITPVGSITTVTTTGGEISGNALANASNTAATSQTTTFGNIVVSGNITSSSGNFIGNGALLTGLPASYANTNVASYLPTYSGNLGGTLTTASQPYITGLGTLGSLAVTGNISAGNISATGISSTLSTAAQTNITSVGTLGSLTVTGNITAANLSTTANVFASTLYTTNGIRWSGNGNLFSSGTSLTFTSATTPPASGNVKGDKWYNTSDDTLYEYINDGTTSYWVDIQSGLVNGNASGTIGPTTVDGNLTVLGNLISVNTVGDIVSVTGNVTLTSTAFGKIHVCTGTTADYTITLPAASGNTGKIITFQMSNALTKLVTLDGNASETIDGSLTRIMWANEAATLYCNGTSWTKIAGKSVPMNVLLYKTGGNQSVGSGVATKLTLETLGANTAPAAMYDTSLSRIKIVRPGLYNITHSGRITNISTSTNSETLGYKNGSEYAITSRYMTTGDWGSCQFSMLVSAVVNDYFETYVRQYSGGNQNFLSGDFMNSIYAYETSVW